MRVISCDVRHFIKRPICGIKVGAKKVPVELLVTPRSQLVVFVTRVLNHRLVSVVSLNRNFIEFLVGVIFVILVLDDTWRRSLLVSNFDYAFNGTPWTEI